MRERIEVFIGVGDALRYRRRVCSSPERRPAKISLTPSIPYDAAVSTRGILAAFLCLSLCACGTEVGRVAFAGEGKGESAVTLQGTDVSFWTDIDIEYEGSAQLAYNVELLQGGAPVATTVCNPLGRIAVKTGWTETNLGSSHSRRGNGKMDCVVNLPKAGPTTVRATLAFAQKPQSLVVKKADLVVKQ